MIAMVERGGPTADEDEGIFSRPGWTQMGRDVTGDDGGSGATREQ